MSKGRHIFVALYFGKAEDVKVIMSPADHSKMSKRTILLQCHCVQAMHNYLTPTIVNLWAVLFSSFSQVFEFMSETPSLIFASRRASLPAMPHQVMTRNTAEVLLETLKSFI